MIRKPIITVLLLVTHALAFGQAAPKPYGVLPSARQIGWHETEMYCIIHYGLDTYTDKEWGYGNESPELLNPSKFSALQIVNAAKKGGFKGVVVVAKHHDGFCLWPTKTTSHNISKSPYRKGKGDMIKEYELACKKLGMKLGLYCSPWDRNNATYGKPAYVDIYRQQLKELYANYGQLFMSWHDGANGGDGYYGGANETRKIDRTTYYGWDSTWAITRKMQPLANIFGDVGLDVRWVGNEEGRAGTTHWATYTPQAPDEGKLPANGYVKYWEGVEGTRNGKYWIPAECDVPLRPGWFYHKAQDGQTKSPYYLLNLYYESVGRGANLDLGISPNHDGVISSEDEQILEEFGKLLKQTFAINLLKGARLTASNVRGGNTAKYGTQNLLDGNRYTYWATSDNVTKPTLEIDLQTAKTFNVIQLRENIKLGQRIEKVALDMDVNGEWKEIAGATSIGANRLIRLSKNVTARKLRLRILQSPVCVAISELGIYKEPVHLSVPMITRSGKGLVTLSTEAPVSSIHYTVDGTAPTPQSPVYDEPFALPNGGVIKARSFETKQQYSEIATRQFGLVKTGWKALTPSTGTGTSQKAIDDYEETFWSSTGPASAVTNLPQDFVVDMGTSQLIKAFTYLPRQDKKADGIIDNYSYAVSTDGLNWKVAAEGEFANIKSNPIAQTVQLSTPVSARYFKLTGKHVVSGSGITIAEIGVNIK
ncbi:discoidin domain-containing protein [Mucilaginibacter sp. PAMB04274]|uniref:discoidin domain-containing protein n=1 Tax=Mucilaginibacter sp. PAMB04274 TaxID=3138568 RepID=UPI0031F6E52B